MYKIGEWRSRFKQATPLNIDEGVKGIWLAMLLMLANNLT